jgi:hypothetical protein
MTNISDNGDAMNTTNNSNKDTNLNGNTMDNSLNDQDDDGVFDELAFLCSGQFKSGRHHINNSYFKFYLLNNLFKKKETLKRTRK